MTTTGGRVRVGLDVSAIPADPRGAGRYVIELAAALGRRGVVDLALETRRGDRERWASVAPGARVSPVVPDTRPRRLVWEQIAAPRFVDRWGIDVLHCPHYTMPEVARTPKVVTIHDLTFFDHPELHEKVKVAVFKRAVRVAAERADALVCVSAATARRLRELFDPPCPVHVIPHGLDHAHFTTDGDEAADLALLAAVGVRPPYVAFAATIEPRKDVPTLVRAFDRIAADHPDLTLAVAGGRGWGTGPTEKALAASPFRDRIVVTGYVAAEVVPALFRRAAVVSYPAIEEGFGLPVLEALACGAPVVTTAGSVMDEIAEGAAITTPPGDDAALAGALASVLAGRDDLAARRTAGLAVAARHTWDATAAAHEDVYARVAEGRASVS